MSERGAYELEDGTLVRTQGEVPKGQTVKKVGIPVGHQHLIDYINGIIARERSQACVTPERMLVGHPDEPETIEAPPPPPAAPKTDEAEMRRRLAQSLRGMEAESIEEKILESDGPTFARFILAGIERLGSLGKEGWQHMNGFLVRDYQRVTAVDRGLRYLALAQVAELNRVEEARQMGKFAPVKTSADASN